MAKYRTSNTEIFGMVVMLNVMPDIVPNSLCAWQTREAVNSIGTQGMMHAMHWAYHFYCDMCLWDHARIVPMRDE